MDTETDQPRLINSWDVMRAIRIPARLVYWPVSDGGKWQQGNTKGREGVLRRWRDVQAANPTVTEWATIGATGGSPWFPASYVPAIEALKWDRTGRPIRCATGTPCEVTTHPDQWHFGTCARPVAEGNQARWIGSDGLEPACKMHGAGQRKRDERDAKWRAEWAERDSKNEAQRAMDQASREWALRLRDELGVKAEGHRHDWDSDHLRVLVEPERLYRQVVSLLDELRALGLDELSTFVPGEVPGS